MRSGASIANGAGGTEGGFATVDALVGLVVLAMTVSLALQALTGSRRLAERALEIGQAEALLQYLVDAGTTSIGVHTGRVGAFQWNLRVAAEPLDMQAPAVRLCRQEAELVERRSGRHYHLQTISFCSPPDPSK